MNKGKVARLVGFVGALGLSTALVTTAVQGTGAYFSDSADFNLTGNTGSVGLQVSTADSGGYADSTSYPLALSFNNIWPGNRTDGEDIGYKVTAKGGTVDLWLTFDPDDAGYQRLTGGKNAPLSILPNGDSGGLGQYGFFQVSDQYGGLGFKTSNLAFDPTDNLGTNSATSNMCPTSTLGRGGSNFYVQTGTDGPNTSNTGDANESGYCGIPNQILLRQDIQDGWEGTVTIILGLNGYKAQNDLQDVSLTSIPFNLVATQHGQRP